MLRRFPPFIIENHECTPFLLIPLLLLNSVVLEIFSTNLAQAAVTDTGGSGH